MSNEEVHQDVFAVRKGLNGRSKTDREVFYEELCIFSVYEGGISGDHAVVVRQFRTEHPQPLFLIPVMSSGRKSDNSVLKCSPHLEGKVDLISGETDIFVQVENSSGGDQIGVKKPSGGVCLDETELGAICDRKTTQECPVSGGRGLDLAGPEDDDLLDTDAQLCG